MIQYTLTNGITISYSGQSMGEREFLEIVREMIEGYNNIQKAKDAVKNGELHETR